MPAGETPLTLPVMVFDLLSTSHHPKLAALVIHLCVCLQVQPAPFLVNEPQRSRNVNVLLVYHCVPHTIPGI